MAASVRKNDSLMRLLYIGFKVFYALNPFE